MEPSNLFGLSDHLEALSKHGKSTVAQSVEVILHRGERWEILWQHCPLAPRRGHVLDRIPNRAHLRLAGPPNLKTGGMKGCTKAHSLSVLSLA